MPPKKKTHGLCEGQRTLFNLGITQENHSEEQEDPTETPTETEVRKEVRKFQSNWLTTFPWLRYDSEKNAMTCDVCVKCKRNNTFTHGNQNFKTSSLKDHIKSTDHQTALIVPNLQDNLKKSQEKQQSGKDRAVTIALKSIYWIAKEGIALVKFRSLLNFLKSIGVEDLELLSLSPGITYESDYAAHEFLSSLQDAVEQKTNTVLAESPCITALADESTDRTVTHRLVIYAQTVNPISMQPWTMYLTNIELVEGTGAAISAAIFEQFEKRNVPKSKIMGLGSDGASAMTGKCDC